MKKFIIRVSIFLALFIAASAWAFNWYSENSVVRKGEVDILKGASARQVADLLQANGVIENASAFYYYIRLKESYYQYIKKEPYRFQVNFKEGYFIIKAKDFDGIIAQLNKGVTNKPKKKTGDSHSGYVTIPEGKNIEEMAEILQSHNVIDAIALIDYTQNPENYNALRKKYIWLPEYNPSKRFQLEGYLHGNTYDLSSNMLPGKVLDVLLAETNKWYETNKVAITESGFTFDQLMTLASVVERESKFAEDRPKVAQVFYNRLASGMKLESDITAAYGNGEHKVFMYYDDIDNESPYNTYRVPGLPIGPIASPSKTSFEAVLKPAGSQFKAIYFYARPNGETYYAETFEEHEQNRLKYESEWKAIEKSGN